MSVVLDTHIWIWWLTGDKALSEAERDALDAEATSKGCNLPAISLWEAQMLHAKGRLRLPLPFDAWLAQAADPRILTVLPVDVKVVSALNRLPPSFHGDPADRMIVATAKAHSLPLATRDASIRRSRVAKLWKPG
ncbi:MAG: type II toxin-antitoxin system VapC family toxin [Betaproteobacteria bacterium]|nr:type II toxin-antitoxin system VapC family toxin [Betaproteobacteria bacterium]